MMPIVLGVIRSPAKVETDRMLALSTIRQNIQKYSQSLLDLGMLIAFNYADSGIILDMDSP